jgi:hypothetical protein
MLMMAIWHRMVLRESIVGVGMIFEGFKAKHF